MVLNAENKFFFSDKIKLRLQILEIYKEIGMEYDPNATAEESRALIFASGVRPEDNLFSCGIISARDGE